MNRYTEDYHPAPSVRPARPGRYRAMVGEREYGCPVTFRDPMYRGVNEARHSEARRRGGVAPWEAGG